MDTIRLANPEEVEAIASQADLIPGSAVIAFGSDRAIVRTAVEVDPVICESPRRKLILMSHLETWMRLNGVPVYYFNIHADETEWRDQVEKWGAQAVSTVPEVRYRKLL